MASTRRSYPTIPARSWWALRERFRQAIPTSVTSTYLATVLEISERSAKTHVLGGLKAVGIVQDDGTPGPRANRWRDDEHYPEVCREIREAIYPQELRDAVPDPSNMRSAAESWFLTTTGCGKQSAQKMTSLYSLLIEATPPSREEGTAGTSTKARQNSPDSKPKPPPKQPGHETQAPASTRQASGIEMPEMRLNLEIRIDASVTPEQIDHIFSSMAKHLYHREGEGE